MEGLERLLAKVAAYLLFNETELLAMSLVGVGVAFWIYRRKSRAR